MAIEKDFKSFNKDIQRAKGIVDKSQVYSYEEAIELVKSKLSVTKVDEVEDKLMIKEKGKQTKADFRRVKREVREDVQKVVYDSSLRVRDMNTDKLIETLVEEICGYDILSDAMYDDAVSDVFSQGYNNIYMKRNGVDEKYHRSFRNEEHYKNFIERIARVGGKEPNNGDQKTVDSQLYEDRIMITSPAVTPKGYTMSIRKHSESHVVLPQIVAQNVMNQDMADLFGHIIVGERNLIYAGITGSGKTTTLRALFDHYMAPANKRVFLIEDTQEMFLKNEHTVEILTNKNYTISHGIITALRGMPKYILIGEVRGKEMKGAVESAETGHGTGLSMHAGKAINVIDRAVDKYQEGSPSASTEMVERKIGSSFDYIGIQDDIPGVGRRVNELVEVGYDYDKRQVTLKTIYRYNFENDSFDMVNKISPEKARDMLRRGVKREDIAKYVEGWS